MAVFLNPGVSYDNTAIESFFSRMKMEEINGYTYPSPRELWHSIESFITFYNEKIPHSSIGNIPTVQGRQRYPKISAMCLPIKAIVDFDSQANLSKGLGITEPAKDENTICQPMWADMCSLEMPDKGSYIKECGKPHFISCNEML